MGPRPFSRGNPMRQREWFPCSRSLQWGHGLSAVEIPYLTDRGTFVHNGFNGATAFQPWKYLRLVPIPQAAWQASMGPRPFSRGNEGPRPFATTGLQASMGPRPFSRGNDDIREDFCDELYVLQWGHGLSAVEIWCSIAGIPRRPIKLQWGHGLSAVEIARLATCCQPIRYV